MINPDNLLEELKDYLCITYDDDRTDVTLLAALARGKSILEDYAGGSLDFSQRGAAQQLLFDYCRYVRSQATEMFEINYRHDLIALRALQETEAAKNASNQDDS